MVRRPYPPGAHGPKKIRRKLTAFGTQFREKQKAKIVYGLLERQFRSTFDESKRRKGNTADALIELLESRLDNVVFRLGFAKTRDQARQLVNHGHIDVNGARVTIPSYRVKTGQSVSARSGAKAKYWSESFRAGLQKYAPPGWLTLDAATLSGKVVDTPTRVEGEQTFDPTLVVEFYSR